MGCFHDVVAVGVQSNVISLLNEFGEEYMICFRPSFNQKIGEFQPVEVHGEFGSFDTADYGLPLHGIMLKHITAVSVIIDFDDPDEDFHSRSLTVSTDEGTQLQWELYCNGHPTEN